MVECQLPKLEVAGSSPVARSNSQPAQGNLGLAFEDLGEPRKAIEFYGQQLMIVRAIGDRGGEGNTLFNKSLALEALGERAPAIASAEEALTIFEQIETPNTAKVRAQLALWREDTPQPG